LVAKVSRPFLDEVNEKLEALKLEVEAKKRLPLVIEVANALLELLTPETKFAANEVIDDRLVPLPNAERQDHWFHKHPWMGDERSAFDVFDGQVSPIQAKLYWMKKRSRQNVAGGVHLTENWEDRDFTRNKKYKIGVDFFVNSAADSVLVVLSNRGNLRLVELKEKLTNTQIDVFSKWADIRGEESHERLHSALWDSFKLQSVNDSFYLGVANSFTELLQELTSRGRDEEEAKLFASRLLGRIMFVWFLRNMELVNENIGYFEVDKDSASYYQQKLEPLFFETLNRPVGDRAKVSTSSSLLGVDDFTPYLNGGLFEPHDGDWYGDRSLTFPEGFFERLYEHFSHYNFTTDESTPEYEQVAIDPEMLGRVFESLLATQIDETGEQARKAKGAFYTPREIVSYMCKETTRTYLKSQFESDVVLKKAVDLLLDTNERDWAASGTNAIRDAIPLSKRPEMLNVIRKMTVIDPACGSGAFPMGMVSLLMRLHERLEPGLNKHQAKLSILQRNIFGVDIEPMAVEISRLRAWLSIIVEKDESQKVEPLPNLDFKFVCANTLIPLESGEQNLGLFSDFSLGDQLAVIRDKYFVATDVAAKKQLRDEYSNLTTTNDDGFDDPRTQQVKSFKPFSYEHPAKFFDSETMFGISGGFDLVVGNPPYKDYRKIDPGTKAVIRYYKLASHSNMVNLYTYFFELGLNLLGANGVLGYISPQQYLIYPNCKGLRDIFRENNLVLLADFARVKVFDASTYTFVSIIEKSLPKEPARYLEFNQLENLDAPVRTLEIPNPIPEPVNISNFATLVAKIESASESRLDAVANVFCASSSTTLNLSPTEEIGPKLLTASDIFEWKFKEPRQRVEKKSYGSASARKQEGPVIYTSRMTKSIRAVTVEDGQFLGGKVNVVTPHDLKNIWLVEALLNSKLITFWYREKYSMQHMQGGALPINTTELAELPLILNGPNAAKIGEKSKSLHSADGAEFDALRSEVENLIYGLYGLTEEDVEVLEARYAEYKI
jgi:hypothetical protein